ncbi:MAG: HEPN domain-containing protein [Thermoproteota archaeon]
MTRAEDFIEDAENFLGAASDLFKTGRWSKVCFNAEQAADLSLKAVLNHYGVERRTHSLVDLLDELIKMDERFKFFQEGVKIIGPVLHTNKICQCIFKQSFEKVFHGISGQASDKFGKIISRGG